MIPILNIVVRLTLFVVCRSRECVRCACGESEIDRNLLRQNENETSILDEIKTYKKNHG